jgi:hypothetical protein
MTVAHLERIYARESGRAGFSHLLAEAVASGSPVLERNGAWLLRRLVDDSGQLAPADWELVVDGLGGVRDWVARLELCRIIADHPGLTLATSDSITDFLRSCAGDKKPFVRAWGVTAWHILGRAHPAHRAEARRWMAKARRDPAKSVQARLRHLSASR